MCETAVIADELNGFGLRITENCVLEKMQDISLKWEIDPPSLAEKYVAFQRNQKFSENISLKNVEAFDRELSARLESSRSKAKPVQRETAPLLPRNMIQELIDVEACDQQQSLLSSYVPGLNFEPIVSASQNEIHKKENIPYSIKPEPSQSSPGLICHYPLECTVELCTNTDYSTHWVIELLGSSEASFAYMNQTALEKAEILDNWAWTLAKRILSSLPEDDAQLLLSDSQATNPHQPLPNAGASQNTPVQPSLLSTEASDAVASQTLVSCLRASSARLQSLALVAGRIATVISAPDPGLASSGGANSAELECKQRLQASNIGLVGLRRIEANLPGLDAVVRLVFIRANESSISDIKLTNSGTFSLYCGQPVVLRCANPTGQLIRVAEVFQASPGAPADIETSSPPSNDLHVMVACGPYTMSDSSGHDLILALLRCVKKHRPHVLILMGPFVDARQPTVETYSETTFDELFQSRLNMVAEYCSHLNVQVVVVPSSNDISHDPVYPTPPFNKDWTKGTANLVARYQKVLFTWDPCLFRVGKYVFGVTSTDVLLHLSGEEVSTAPTSGDRISRLCRHLLASGTFYPVHPPADDLPVDYPLWDVHARMSATPHCLITPSRLRPFAKPVDGVMCINPGRVSRGQASGSFACLVVRDTNPASPTSRCSISDRCVVQIHRL